MLLTSLVSTQDPPEQAHPLSQVQKVNQDMNTVDPQQTIALPLQIFTLRPEILQEISISIKSTFGIYERTEPNVGQVVHMSKGRSKLVCQ